MIGVVIPLNATLQVYSTGGDASLIPAIGDGTGGDSSRHDALFGSAYCTRNYAESMYIIVKKL